MRYLGRTHGVSVSWLHEVCNRGDIELVYEESSRMCADIYTKAFTDVAKWQTACWLINIADPAEMKKRLRLEQDSKGAPPPQQGGGSTPNAKQ